MGKTVILDSTGNGGTVKFDLFIVPEKVWNADEKCPYCECKGMPLIADYLDHKAMNAVADIMQCTDCRQPFLIVEYPAMDRIKEPIMTTWHVRDDNLA